jgi:hypothetical protein
MLNLAVEREIELAEEMLFEGEIPGGIEGAEIVEKISDGHPLGEFLIFGDVADVSEDFSGDVGGGVAEHLRGAGGGAKDVHQELDDGGLAGAIRTDERIDGAWRDGEVETLESSGAAIAAGEVLGLDYGGHFFLRPPGSGVVGF